MAPNGIKLDTPKRMSAALAGVLLVFGVTFYIAKRNIAEKRKQDLSEYRMAQANAIQPASRANNTS